MAPEKPYWGFLKVSCVQVHVSGLPVHTLVVTLHLLCWGDNDGEHRTAVGPGRCWSWSTEIQNLDLCNVVLLLFFSMNINSSMRRVIRTEGQSLCQDLDQDLDPQSRLVFTS